MKKLTVTTLLLVLTAGSDMSFATNYHVYKKFEAEGVHREQAFPPPSRWHRSVPPHRRPRESGLPAVWPFATAIRNEV
jgi:hypothetical protein